MITDMPTTQTNVAELLLHGGRLTLIYGATALLIFILLHPIIMYIGIVCIGIFGNLVFERGMSTKQVIIEITYNDYAAQTNNPFGWQKPSFIDNKHERAKYVRAAKMAAKREEAAAAAAAAAAANVSVVAVRAVPTPSNMTDSAICDIPVMATPTPPRRTPKLRRVGCVEFPKLNSVASTLDDCESVVFNWSQNLHRHASLQLHKRVE